MYKFLTVLSISILLSQLLHAQIWPAEGSKLDYRLIGFKFPAVPKVSDYKIEIAKCNCYTEDSFKKKIVKILPIKKNKIITELYTFGAPFTWRYSY